MSDKTHSNSLWKADILEHKFFGYRPRFKSTITILGAKNNQKLVKKFPSSKEEAKQEIDAIKLKVFGNKYYGAINKLKSEVKKIIKADVHRWAKKNEKSDLSAALTDDVFLNHLVESKIVKTVQTTLLTKKELKETPPPFIPGDIVAIINNKDHESNPSRIFKTYCQNNKDMNNYISSLWNNKGIKAVLGQAEWSFRLVRGNLTQDEVNNRRVSLGKAVRTEDDEESDDESDSDSEDDEESEGTDSDEEEETNDKHDNEFTSEDVDLEQFAVYDNLVAGSDEEEEVPELDPNVNYNEVTDEEPSDSEEEDEEVSESEEEVEKKPKKTAKKDEFFADSSDESEDEEVENKYNLPELTTGYISGGSDDEDFQVDNDRVVKQATSQRKNRRGQRARQKIWEKKYGSAAKHKAKEIAAEQNDRKRRQLEFEERERKRQEKMKNAPSGSNLTPIGTRSEAPTAQKPAPTTKTKTGEEHPSWLAKKQAEEKLKNVKFQGKKITFD